MVRPVLPARLWNERDTHSPVLREFGAEYVSRYELPTVLTREKAGKVATIQPGAGQAAKLTHSRADQLGMPFVENAFETTMSSERVDRHGDTISASGWRYNSFRKAGGPLLWSHASFITPPGNMRALWKETTRGEGRGRLRGIEAYHRETQLSEDLYRLVDGGHLKSGSVGFIPIKWQERFSDDKSRRLGFHFSEQELVEYSKTPTPANPDALIGREFPGLMMAMEKAIDLGVAGMAVRKAYRAMNPSKIQVDLIDLDAVDLDEEEDDKSKGLPAKAKNEEVEEDTPKDDAPKGEEKGVPRDVEGLFRRADTIAEDLTDAADRFERCAESLEKAANLLSAAVEKMNGDGDEGGDDDTDPDKEPVQPAEEPKDESPNGEESEGEKTKGDGESDGRYFVFDLAN